MKLSIITILALLSIACTKTATPVELSSVCAGDNEKKYVSTVGVLDDRGSIFCSNIGGGPVRCGVDIVANTGGAKVFSADIEEGSSSSEIEKLESGYKASDIKVHDNSGGLVKIGEKAKFTGQMSIVPDGSVCFMTVDKIEKQ